MTKRFRRFLAALIAASGLAGASAPALSTDMPAKAQAAAPIPTCTITQCSGWYLGGHVEGLGSNADILGSGIQSSIFAGGAGLGGHAGYQLWNGNFFAAAEIGGTYDVGGQSFVGQ